MRLINLIITMLSLLPLTLSGGERIALTLDDAIARARVRSVSAEASLQRLRSAYWEFRTYRADLLPEVSFNATLPGYYKQYNPYQNSDGSYSFVHNNYLDLTGTLAVSQNIWLTGGKLSLNTSLDYLRQFNGVNRNRFMSIPVALTLDQPIFGVNTVKWDRRIEPVRYAEAKAQFLSETEDVALTAIQGFFSLLLARENVNIAEQNRANASKLYEVAQEKRRMGSISNNDLLQMELNLLTATSDLTDAQSDYKSAMFQLITFLGYGDDVEIDPVEPGALPDMEVSYADALDKALSRNKFAKNQLRRQLQAEYDVAKAKGDLRKIDLHVQVGLTGTGQRLRNAYDPLKDNQIVEVGISIPLLDWGKRRGRVKTAQSQLRLTESQLRQEEQEFSQDLFILVERFNNQRVQVRLAEQADTIAGKRYATNFETFLIGKISTLDLNDSQTVKDDSRRRLLNERFSYFSYYYRLRSLTLWDFSTDTPIEADIEAILRQ